LRFDFSFFVLRFDLAIPVRKPYLDPSERWVIKDINFRDKDWRGENMLFNIAIGYPF
jgi:outer membrane protein insertion porin family